MITNIITENLEKKEVMNKATIDTKLVQSKKFSVNAADFVLCSINILQTGKNDEYDRRLSGIQCSPRLTLAPELQKAIVWGKTLSSITKYFKFWR